MGYSVWHRAQSVPPGGETSVLRPGEGAALCQCLVSVECVRAVWRFEAGVGGGSSFLLCQLFLQCSESEGGPLKSGVLHRRGKSSPPCPTRLLVVSSWLESLDFTHKALLTSGGKFLLLASQSVKSPGADGLTVPGSLRPCFGVR